MRNMPPNVRKSVIAPFVVAPSIATRGRRTAGFFFSFFVWKRFDSSRLSWIWSSEIKHFFDLCMSDKGEVFVWGYGILGKGPNLSESSTPEMIPSTLFGQSDFNPTVAVTRIRCGLNHFAAVTGEKAFNHPAAGPTSWGSVLTPPSWTVIQWSVFFIWC